MHIRVPLIPEGIFQLSKIKFYERNLYCGQNRNRKRISATYFKENHQVFGKKTTDGQFIFC